MPEITTFLTFASQAEEAVRHYLSVFEDGKVLETMKNGDAVMSVEFELFGKRHVALNCGQDLGFAPGISLLVSCDTQAQIDRYWSGLAAKEVQCGWLVDKYGVSWQIVPKRLKEFLGSKDKVKAGRAMQAMLKMQKLDLNVLQAAFDGAT